MIPSPTDLNYFLEVASALNVSRAAERLGISQPALTVSMQRLEHTIGTALLIRGKKGVALTQAGKQLLAHARDLSQRWEAVKTRALASMHEIQGSYTLGCHVSVALYSLPGFMADLLEQQSELELRLTHDLSRKITERVIQMEVDIGIVVNPVRHPDLVIRKLCDDEVTLWVGKGKRKIQDIRSGEAVLICDPELIQTQHLVRNLKKGGIRYRRILASSNLEVVTELAASGAGVAILPGRVASRAAAQGLQRLSRAPIFHDEICVLYRVENKSVRSIRALADRIASTFERDSRSK
ncbi:MAG: LysR family transcriptional regulator [Bdellovibrionales bacterium]